MTSTSTECVHSVSASSRIYHVLRRYYPCVRHSAGTAASIVDVHVSSLTSRNGADTPPPAPEAACLRELLRHGHVDEGKAGRRRRGGGRRTGLNAMMMMVAWDGHASQTLAMM